MSDPVRRITAPGRARRRAFSLAELMIALAILGMGLLVIGAALPIGVRYTQESVTRATGEAAAEYALDLIEQNVRAVRQSFVEDVPHFTSYPKSVGLFQPRWSDGIPDPNFPNGVVDGRFAPTHEPLIKVRPLYTTNICVAPGHSALMKELPNPRFSLAYPVVAEDLVSRWIALVHSAKPAWVEVTQEADLSSPSNWLSPVLPSSALVFPPITEDSVREPDEFLNNKYDPNPILDPDDGGYETRKIRDHRITWCAFYRRVSYDRLPNAAHDGWDLRSDPYLYEFVVVVLRTPSENARFPVQNIQTIPGPVAGSTLPRAPEDFASPSPWLITSDGWPAYYWVTDPANHMERMFDTNRVRPNVLYFAFSETIGTMLPPGSLLIPACNDFVPTWYNDIAAISQFPQDVTQVCGFVPSTRDTLPIYEVIERTFDGAGNCRVTVRDNGQYPWVNSAFNDPVYFPFWVIPPSYEELNVNGDPVFPDKSPIVSVARRFVRLREIP